MAASYDDLIKTVNELIEIINGITNKSKNISQLDILNILDVNGEVPVSLNGEDNKMTIQQLIDYIDAQPISLELIGTNINNVTITENGIRLNGAATIFDDLRVPVSATRAGGTKDPDFRVFKDNGSGSQGVFTQWFDKSVEEELYFSVQMPHAWRQGSNIFPHLHWTPKRNGASGNFVKWGLEYTWINVNGVFQNTTIIYSGTTAETSTVSGDDTMIADKHHISVLGDGNGIDATGKLLSSMLNCRIFRAATDVNDTYNYDAGLLEVDFHYEMDSFGSDDEFTKN